MSPISFLIFGSVFFLFSLVSRRIQGTIFTLPILFTLAGLGISFAVSHNTAFDINESSIHLIAEITLILVLAADASQIKLANLRRMQAIPIRLLTLALPMIIALGTVVAIFVFPEIPWYMAALIAAILAPTDAALGAALLADKTVPLRVRQGLNVESGLNDGIALPAVLFFACFLNLTHQTGDVNWLLYLALQLTLGPLIGVIIGWIGGHLIWKTAEKKWITTEFQGIAAIALAIIAFSAAELVGGNGFIAAFIAGLTYGNLHTDYSKFLHEFTETESQFLAQLTFFLFGLVILPNALHHLDWRMVLYAALSLTVIRIIPVMISMIGKDINWREKLFMGWFGPRGLASLLFALLILEDLGVKNAEFIEALVSVTVLMSVILHGITAASFSARLGRYTAQHAPELSTAPAVDTDNHI